ncbi:MAG: DUF362 domain-containing protein [Spirochaetales bacterium]|nr:DUF362 domain-containing protein [Spirochaetales bacterium]
MTSDHIVALSDCRSYDQAAVDRAVAEAARAAGLPSMTGATVLLKPNLLLASDPIRAATTHPAVVRAAARAVKAAGAARVLVGDSPGWQALSSVAGKTGMQDVIASEGLLWADFSDPVTVDLPGGGMMRRFELAKAVADADIVVNLPKLKTHGLMYYTGAVKNLFGCVPGLRKSAFHLRFPGRADFARMLADLYLAVKPAFCVMDAVVGMEGPGPNNGKPRDIGLILAAKNGFDLDWIAAGVIGYNPADVPYLAVAAGDTRYGFEPSAIKTVGEDPARRVVPHFQRVRVLKETDFFKRHMPAWLHRLARNLTVARPFFSDRRCVRCGACVKICPATALRFEDGKNAPLVDYSSCIRCYCCHEVCPADAIRLRRLP